nr:hypothetical protein CFP56_33480 [Quercus suber]
MLKIRSCRKPYILSDCSRQRASIFRSAPQRVISLRSRRKSVAEQRASSAGIIYLATREFFKRNTFVELSSVVSGWSIPDPQAGNVRIHQLSKNTSTQVYA